MVVECVTLRNQVLQYCMTNKLEMLYLRKPFKNGSVEICGCSSSGNIIGVRDDGTEVIVSYNSLGISDSFRVFDDLNREHCKN
jgi:hypothetical protein